MTKDEWLLVKNKLSYPWGSAELMVDGYRLTLQVKQTKALKFEIMPYVNGQFSGAWMRKDSEEGKRFLRPVSIAAYSPAKKAHLTKSMSKKRIKDIFGDRLDAAYTMLVWGWPTFGPLQRHLIANNQVIELVGEKAPE